MQKGALRLLSSIARAAAGLIMVWLVLTCPEIKPGRLTATEFLWIRFILLPLPILGAACIIWPNKLIAYGFRFNDLHPILARVVPFRRWGMGGGHIPWVRLSGGGFLLVSFLLFLAVQ